MSYAMQGKAHTVTGELQQAQGIMSAIQKGTFTGVVGDLLSTAANMLPSQTIGLLVRSSGAGAALLGAGAGGNAYAQALNEGKTQGEALTYGVVTAILEGGLQYVLGGIAGLSKGAASSLLAKIMGGAGKEAAAKIATTSAFKAVLQQAGKYGKNMLSEGFEEYLQDVLNPIVRNIVFDENNNVNLLSPDALYSAFLGALSAGLMNAPSVGVDISADVKETAANIDAKAYDNLKNGIATAADIQRIAKSEELFSEAVRSAIVEQTATKDQRVAALTKANEAVKAERLAAGEDLTKTTADVAVETAQQLDFENRMSNVSRLFKGEKLNEAEIGDIVSDKRSRTAIQDYVRENKSLADLIGLQFFAEKDP